MSYLYIKNITKFSLYLYIHTLSFWVSLILCVHYHISLSLLDIWTAITNSASLSHRLVLLFQSDGYQLPDYSITALMNPVRLLTVLSLLSWAIGNHLSLWIDFIWYCRDMQNAEMCAYCTNEALTNLFPLLNSELLSLWSQIWVIWSQYDPWHTVSKWSYCRMWATAKWT